MRDTFATEIALDALSRILELATVSSFCEYALPDGELDAPRFDMGWSQVGEGEFDIQIRISAVWDGRLNELADAVVAMAMVPAISKVRFEEADGDDPVILACSFEMQKGMNRHVEAWLARYHQHSVRSTWRRQ